MAYDEIERRKFLRVKFPFTVHIHHSQTSPLSTYTEDISEGGIRFRTRQELGVFSLVGLEIYLKLRPIRCKGKIIWAKKRKIDYFNDETFFDTGVEFQELKTEDKSAIRERLERVITEIKMEG